MFPAIVLTTDKSVESQFKKYLQTYRTQCKLIANEIETKTWDHKLETNGKSEALSIGNGNAKHSSTANGKSGVLSTVNGNVENISTVNGSSEPSGEVENEDVQIVNSERVIAASSRRVHNESRIPMEIDVSDSSANSKSNNDRTPSQCNSQTSLVSFNQTCSISPSMSSISSLSLSPISWGSPSPRSLSSRNLSDFSGISASSKSLKKSRRETSCLSSVSQTSLASQTTKNGIEIVPPSDDKNTSSGKSLSKRKSPTCSQELDSISSRIDLVDSPPTKIKRKSVLDGHTLKADANGTDVKQVSKSSEGSYKYIPSVRGESKYVVEVDDKGLIIVKNNGPLESGDEVLQERKRNKTEQDEVSHRRLVDHLLQESRQKSLVIGHTRSNRRAVNHLVESLESGLAENQLLVIMCVPADGDSSSGVCFVAADAC